MQELEVHLYSGFRKMFRELSPQTRRSVLETLKRLAKQPDLEPSRRMPDAEHQQICLIDFLPECVLAYCVEYVESGTLLVNRTPVRVFATLRKPSENWVELLPLED